MDTHIFISYSRADETKVHRLCNDLVSLDLNCWLDVTAIPSGANWDRELQKGIETSSHLIVICTPTSMSSKNVQAEWQYAFELGKPIHPVILETCDIPFRLRIYQVVDFVDLGYEVGLEVLIKSLPHVTTTRSSKTESNGIERVDALIQRSVENWKSFGLLLDKQAIVHIDKRRDEIEHLDATALALMFLSARKNHISIDYWLKRIRENSTATDRVHDCLIDDLKSGSIVSFQSYFETLASQKLLSKIAHIIDLMGDDSGAELLLDSIARLLTQKEAFALNFDEIEKTLLRRFSKTPNKVLARSLGWLNSAPIADEAAATLEGKNLDIIMSDAQYQCYLVALANMRSDLALHVLQRLTPDGFALISAGWFIMGTSDDDTSFSHNVFVPSFWLRKIPVTQVEYREKQLHPFTQTTGQKPISNISWTDARHFIEKLRAKNGLPFSLPTEAMWEKAASWHPIEKRKLEFPWGNEPDFTRCNTVDGNRKAISNIGDFSPRGDSIEGVQELVGNLWEWTSSLWKPYPYHARDGREGSEAGHSLYVLRGSSFFAKRGFIDGTTTRVAFDDSYAFHDAGMRIALVVDI
jgi:hypothetical protein